MQSIIDTGRPRHETPPGVVYEDEPMRLSLTDSELRLVIYEATRVKNGRVREVRIELDGGVKCIPLVRAA